VNLGSREKMAFEMEMERREVRAEVIFEDVCYFVGYD